MVQLLDGSSCRRAAGCPPVVIRARIAVIVGYSEPFFVVRLEALIRRNIGGVTIILVFDILVIIHIIFLIVQLVLILVIVKDIVIFFVIKSLLFCFLTQLTEIVFNDERVFDCKRSAMTS
jgi:hypothetical protein